MRSIYQGKAESVLPQFPDACFDALVCDPPAGISFMGKDWDCFRRTHNPNDVGRNNVFGRVSRTSPHSYGESDRERFIAAMTLILTEAMRTLKPGGHALIWALPRTSHWTMCAIEDAGFEIRDTIHHIFATGMPKGQNINKALDKAHKPEAAQWEGWNTTMKPAVEYWILARKPLAESTIAKQVLATGTGALNIDACRISTTDSLSGSGSAMLRFGGQNSRPYQESFTPPGSQQHEDGRWPANLVLSHSSECIPLDRITHAEDRRKVSSGKGFCTTKYSGSAGEGEGTIIAGVRDYGDAKDALAWQCTPECPIAVLNAQSGTLTSGKSDGFDGPYKAAVYGKFSRNMIRPETIYADTGGASRYFTTLPYEAPFIYLPKASPKDKTMNGMVENGHETVKSTALMAWLCTLITPPGGTILDCFMGSGSTLVAAERLGFSWVGIDESPEYCAISRARLATLGVTVYENDTQYQEGDTA